MTADPKQPTRVPGLYRPRLLARLQTLLVPPATCVWLAAGAGMGKTTLARQWLEGAPGPAFWIGLDPSAGDAASVLLRLQVLSAGATPVWKEQLAAPDHALRPAWRQAWAALQPGTRLVIDDLHAAGRDEVLATWLTTAVDTCPPGIDVLLLSRRPPPVALARAQVGGRLTCLPAGELAFTAEEVQAWRPQSQARWAGWPAALSAAVVEGDDRSETLLLRLVEHEVLRELAADERATVTTLAWWPGVVDAASAEQMAGPRAPGHLDDLCGRGLLVDGVAGGWRLHELLALALRADAGVAAWSRTLAVLDATGRADDAITVALLRCPQDVEAASERLVAQAPRWLAECRHRLLAQACQAVPEASRPAALWAVLAAALAPLDPRAGREAAVRLLGQTDDPGLRRGALVQIIASYFQTFDRTEPLSHWLSQLQALPPSDDSATAVAAFSALFLREPAHPALPRWQQAVQTLPAQATDPNLRLRATMLLAKQSWYTGRHAGLGLLTLQAAGALQTPGLSPYSQLLWGLARQYQAWGQGDPDLGREAGAQALAHAQACGLHGLDRYLRLHDACFAALAGDEAAALEQLARAAHGADASRRMEAWHLLSVQAWLALERGLLAEARESAALAVEAGAAMGPAPQAMSWVIAAQVALAEGVSPGEAMAALRVTGAAGLNPRVTLLGHWLHAAAWRPGDDESTLADALDMALAGMQAAGGGLWFGLHRATAARLASWALEHRIRPEAAAQLVKQHRLAPPPDAGANWPWPLRLRAGPILQIERDGQPLVWPAKQPRRPLELLSLLVALGGEAPATVLADRLWPEAEGDHALDAFEVALRRLRGLLGQNDLLTLRGGMLSLDRRQVWVESPVTRHPSAKPHAWDAAG